MKKIIISFLILIFIKSIGYSFLLPAKPTINELLKADIIVLGKIESLTKEENDVFQVETISVDLFNASVKIEHVLKGKCGSDIVLKKIYKADIPSSYIGKQLIEADKTYILFLAFNEKDKTYNGINPVEYAIELLNMPKFDVNDLTLDQDLRQCALSNIENVDEKIAVRWLQVISEIYDEEIDSNYLQKKIDDPRLTVKGQVLSILCEKGPWSESLYPTALAFLKDNSQNNHLYLYRNTISKFLPRTFKDKQVSSEILKDWLNTEIRELQEVAINTIAEKRDGSLTNEVSALMNETKDESIQYNCYKALCAIAGKENYPAWDPFFESKDKYIKEIKDLISNQQQNK